METENNKKWAKRQLLTALSRMLTEKRLTPLIFSIDIQGYSVLEVGHVFVYLLVCMCVCVCVLCVSVCVVCVLFVLCVCVCVLCVC